MCLDLALARASSGCLLVEDVWAVQCQGTIVLTLGREGQAVLHHIEGMHYLKNIMCGHTRGSVLWVLGN